MRNFKKEIKRNPYFGFVPIPLYLNAYSTGKLKNHPKSQNYSDSAQIYVGKSIDGKEVLYSNSPT